MISTAKTSPTYGSEQRANAKSRFSGGGTWFGIRDGKWKYYLLMNRENKIAGEELYDILEDPGEKKNLAKKYPEVAVELKKKVLEFKTELPEKVESTGKYKHQY